MDRLRTYLFKPTKFTHDSTTISLHSPKLNHISEVGENVYNIYLTFCTFNFTNMFEFAKNFGILERSDEKSDYLNAVGNRWIVNVLCESIEFFAMQPVYFNDSDVSFYVDDGIIICETNYQDFSSIIRSLNALEEKKDKTFRNEISKKKHERYEELRKKYESNKDTLELKDICSILCHADGNGINVFNVGELTIYHLYEHYERQNIKENYFSVHQIYTNGLLDDPSKLRSWMVRTKY